MKKVFLDTKKKHSIIKRMEPYWNQENWFVSSDSNSDIQLSFIKQRTVTDLPLVLRLDNPYYDPNMLDHNREISYSHSIADGIIYQSKYSRKICEFALKPRKENSIYKVIYNGHRINWCEKINHEGKNILVISRWRRHKRLFEIIQIFKELIKYQNFKLHIVGSISKERDRRYQETIKEIENNDNIVYHGRIIDSKKLKYIFGITDLMLHLAKRDACPNTVVEAITANIPVITTNACGGATEMIKITSPKNVIHGEDDKMPSFVDPYSEEWNFMVEKIKHRIVINIIRVINQNENFTIPKVLEINYCAKNYLELFDKVLNENFY